MAQISQSGRWWRTAILHLAVLLAWLLAFAAAAALEYAPNASLWFPPAAVSFAAVLVLGARALPVLVLACVVVTAVAAQIYDRNLALADLLLAGFGFALTHVGSYGAVAMILRRAAMRGSPITTLPKVSAFLLGGAVAAGLSSVLGGLSLAVTGMADGSDIPSLIAPWWIGDYAGLVSMAAFCILLLARLSDRLGLAVPPSLRRLPDQRVWRELYPAAIGKLGLLFAISFLILLLAAGFPDQPAIPFLLFVSLTLQFWIVHTESELAALLGVLGFSLLLAVAAGLMGLGEQALILQFVAISLAVGSYLGLTVPALYRDNRRMRQLLTHDGLTGALARDYFEESVRAGVAEAWRMEQPSCLVMVDLNGLKQINDRHGHAAGDRALRILVQCCARQLAPGQLLGRLGGDEFALYLKGSRRLEAEQIVAAIGEELAAQPPIATGLRLSASFGIAELAPGAEPLSYQDLLEAADQAMYQLKRRG